jgi:uncharacterized membrane protein
MPFNFIPIMIFTHLLLYYYILPLKYNIPQAVLHSLMLLKMGKIFARNM